MPSSTPPFAASLPRPVALAILVLALALMLAVASPAAAQAEYAVGVRAGYADLSGGPFDEVYDGEVNPVGLQAEVRWPSVLLRLAAEQADADGDLFIPDTVGGNVLPGSEAEISLDLYHLTVAYNSTAPSGAWGWFAGGGLSLADAEEDSVLGPESSDSTGFHAVAGLRRGLGTRFEVGGELMYLSLADLVANITGDEEDLDGLAAALNLSFRF